MEVTTGSNNYTSVFSALASASSFTNQIYVFKGNTAAMGLILLKANPTAGKKVTLGLTGHTQDYVFVSALTGTAGQVLIETAVADTAENLKSAINGEAGAGTKYVATSPTPNPYLYVTSRNDTVLNISDRIACNRRLALVASTDEATTITVNVPMGGTNGSPVAAILAGITYVCAALDLSDPLLATTNFPAGVVWISDWITLRSSLKTAYLSALGITGSDTLPISYQLSLDTSGLMFSGSESVALTLGSPSATLNIPESCERLRFVIDNSANTTALNIYAVLSSV